jgi:hypothetical protein
VFKSERILHIILGVTRRIPVWNENIPQKVGEDSMSHETGEALLEVEGNCLTRAAIKYHTQE